MSDAEGVEFRSPNRAHDRRYLYKYVTSEVAKLVLTNRKLRWSSPMKFNDPFDFTQELRLDFDVAVLNAALTEEIASLIERGAPSTSVGHPLQAAVLGVIGKAAPQGRNAMAQKLRQHAQETTLGQIQSHAALLAMWRDLVPTFRVLCLSEVNDSTPMWLHYSDSYRGAVLEFESLDEVDSAFLVARPVAYQDAPPAIASPQAWVRCILQQSGASYRDLFTEYQYVKATAWSYEREWRIVSGAGPGESGLVGDYGFHPRELSAIYLGPECSAEDQTDIVALLAHGLEHVSAYKATPDPQQVRFKFLATSR